jgi:hypothetical protein
VENIKVDLIDQCAELKTKVEEKHQTTKKTKCKKTPIGFDQ